MSATSIILKTDKRGHVRRPPERREALLAEYDRSGLSLARFTELAGVRYSTFATWLQHRRIKAGAATQDKEKKNNPKPVQFAEVLVDGKRHAGGAV
jgi:predicted HTH domain antitoxin